MIQYGMRGHPRELRRPALRTWACVLLLASFGRAEAEAGEPSEPVVPTHQIAIKSRSFDPPVVRLKAGARTRLEFRNHDSELHAVVPQQWLAGVTVSVTGNGAPEFGEDGLRRVIIPADGHAELQFIPRRPGTFQYICDMPGHEMQALIEIYE